MLRSVLQRKLLTAALITMTLLAALAATTATGAIKPLAGPAGGPVKTSTDTCGYNPNSAPKPGGGTVVFDENSVTRAIAFYGVGLSGHVGVFANDESGLLIGAGGTPSSTAGQGLVYGEAVPPTFGSGTDLEGRAVAPSLYLTDVTNNSSSNGGDYEQGGTAANAGSPPFASALYGSWSPTVGTKPVNKNNWTLGPHADPIPATDAFGGTTTSFNEGYGAEVVWNVGGLKAWDAAANNGSGGYVALQAGHTYRAQSLTHDTDQNHTSGGGDVGEVCTTFNIPVPPAPHLVISKTPDHGSPVNAGDQVGFTVEVENTGNAAATGVSLNDSLPTGSGSGVTWVIASDPHNAFQLGSSGGHQTLELKSSTLPAGADYTVHITAQTSASECSVYDNSATLSASNAGSAGPASAEETCHPAGIHIVKTADAAQVKAGDPIGFTLTVYNDGSGAAKNVKLSDPLPTKAGLSWSIAGIGTGWGAGGCSISGSTLSCGGANGVTVPGGTTQAGSTYTVHVTSPTTASTGGGCPGGSGVVDNTGTVTTSNAGSDDSRASTCVASPGIHIIKTADAAEVSAGHPIGFTLTVYNDGSGDATGVKLSDPLPHNAGLSWSIDSIGTGWGASGCSISGSTLSCGGANGVTVPAGTTFAGSTFTVHITSPTTSATGGICPVGSGVVDNTGTVTTGNGGSDEASASTCVALADVHVIKTADAPQVHAGAQIGFTLTVYNDGAGDATGVKLSDPLPSKPGLSWSIASQGSGWAGTCVISNGVLSCGGANGVTVPANTTAANSTFTVHIVSGTTEATGGGCPGGSGVVNNTGTVTSANDGSEQSTASTCVEQSVIDLAVTKSGSPNPDTLPGNITWTMVVTNHGPDAATGVKIADPMPAGNTYVSSTTTKGTCTGGALLQCSIGNMAVGESVVITLITTPSVAGTVTNTVTVVGNEQETNYANNIASASVLVVGPHQPPQTFCVAVSKVTPKQLFVGRKAVLTIHLTKHGKAVQGVRVHIKGPKLNMRTKASNSKGVIRQRVRPKKAGIFIFTPIVSKACGAKRLGVTGVFTPPVTG
jgi:uncharacterized repeat protein (TIGR01451 family)